MILLRAYLTLLTLTTLLTTTLSTPRQPGSKTMAQCPVTHATINITSTTPTVTFIKSNQKLYFATEEAADAYRESPRAYWLDPYDLPPAGQDGKRGLPDMHGANVSCAVDGTMFLINTMESSRVMHVGGQCLYFCCNDCKISYWRDPAKFVQDAAVDASSVRRPTGRKCFAVHFFCFCFVVHFLFCCPFMFPQPWHYLFSTPFLCHTHTHTHTCNSGRLFGERFWLDICCC